MALRGQLSADLMLVGDGLQYSEVMERLLPMEEQLGRTINPTLHSLQDGQKPKPAT